MAKGEKYVKGATYAVLQRNGDGVTTESIERDPDGVLWHCTGDEAPVVVSQGDADALIASAPDNVNSEPAE